MPIIPQNGSSRLEGVLSHLTLRRFLGCLGLALPVALLTGGYVTECCLRPSISAYYYSPSPILHSLFVGTMSAIGVFLVCYKGYPKKKRERLSDNWIANAAGIGALGIALFPTDPGSRVECRTMCLGDQSIPWGEGFDNAHIAFSILFFGAVTAMAWFQFAKSQKPARRMIYRVSAVLITLSIATVLILEGFCIYFDQESVIFWLEALAVWAFGAAWLIKGWSKS